MNDDDFSKWIVDTTLKEDRHKGTLYTAYDMCHKLNELYEENEQLRKYNEQLKERLERINGGYGHLTYRNGLTANEWLIESQEKELKKKNEQISDLKEENERLKQQLFYDGDDVCDICKHEYLVPSGDYFIGKCEKGHEECSKEDIKYCEDFKLKELSEWEESDLLKTIHTW